MRKTIATTIAPIMLLGAASAVHATPPAQPHPQPTSHPEGEHGHDGHEGEHHGEKPAH